YADKESNLSYNMARDYAAELGRYYQFDPLGLFGGGLSPYVYVSNRALSRSDSSGLAMSQGEAGVTGGLVPKIGKPVTEDVIKTLTIPGTAGQDAAGEICSNFQGRIPKDLWSECSTACLKRLEILKYVASPVANSWLQTCIKSCEEFFPRCNKPPRSCLPV